MLRIPLCTEQKQVTYDLDMQSGLDQFCLISSHFLVKIIDVSPRESYSVSTTPSQSVFKVRETMAKSATFFFVVVAVLLASVDGNPVRQCRNRRFPYSFADSEQCDKFYRCENGKIREDLCPDGLVYEPESQSCFMPQRVRCGKRIKLQLAQGNAVCPRLNGRFPIDSQCFVYNECVQGTPTKVNCPPGLIFDIDQAVCEFPDIANRTGCSAEEILKFRCPHGSNVQSDQVVLLFGDHERLPKLDDCRYFYMCLKSGRPRLGGCPLGMVFNPITFFCDKPANVAGCENHYNNKD